MADMNTWVTSYEQSARRAEVSSQSRRDRAVGVEGFGVDFTYRGLTGYGDAEAVEGILNGHGVARSVQERGEAWTVRFGPLAREPMRALL